MSETPPGPEAPGDDERGGEAEIDDQPLGVQEDAPDPDDAPLPGVPETEPPSSG